jgi:hypothetical protein
MNGRDQIGEDIGHNDKRLKIALSEIYLCCGEAS